MTGYREIRDEFAYESNIHQRENVGVTVVIPRGRVKSRNACKLNSETRARREE